MKCRSRWARRSPAAIAPSQPSRVMRVEARQYYAIAAASPEISVKVGALARERIGGLQGIAAAPPAAQVIVVGHRWDTACHELRRFLARNQIVFDWMTPDAPELPARWPAPLPAEGDCPALRLADGTTLKRPRAARDRRSASGLQTRARAAEYDTVIVGGGPAGLAAAVYGASEGLRTLVVEREAPGGQAGTSSRIENYLGFPNGVSGDELAGRALQQARRLGAEILVTRNIERIDAATRAIVLDGNEVLRARTVILATGVAWRRLAIDGFDRLIGKGIYFGAARSEAGSTQGLDVHSDRRRELGRPGGAVFRQSRAHRDARRPRQRRWKRACRTTWSSRCAARRTSRVELQSEVRACPRRRSSGGDRHPGSCERLRAPPRLRRALRVHRRGCGDRIGCPPRSRAIPAATC